MSGGGGGYAPMIEKKYENVAELAISLVEGIARTGIKVVALRERYGKLLMPLQGNTNHVGIMYAGSLFTIGEITGGIIHGVTFDIARFYPIVKEITIRFLSPALTDVTVEVALGEAEAASIQEMAELSGKADFRLELELKDTAGKVVAVVQGLWQIRKIPEELKGVLKF